MPQDHPLFLMGQVGGVLDGVMKDNEHCVAQYSIQQYFSHGI